MEHDQKLIRPGEAQNEFVHPVAHQIWAKSDQQFVCKTTQPIGKSPVRIILWCPTTIMVIKACFLIQPLEQEGGCQKCCISLCSKVCINHFYQMKASPECLNILIYWSKCWVERLRRTLRRKVKTGILYQQIYRLCHCILHKVAHIDCSAPSGKQHEPQTGVWVIRGQETAKTQWMEHVQKLIRPGEAHNEWVHQIWSKSDPQKLLDESEARIPRKQQKFSRAWPKVHQAWGVP